MEQNPIYFIWVKQRRIWSAFS